MTVYVIVMKTVNFQNGLPPQVCEMYLTFCGIGITNAKLFELSAIEFNRNRVSTEIFFTLFTPQSGQRKNPCNS